MGMLARSWLALPVVVGGLACQGMIHDSSPSGASAGGGGSGVAGEASGGQTGSPPSFEPLGGPTPITCDPKAQGFASRRIWRLTRQQYNRSAFTLLGDTSQPAAGFNPEPGSEQGF